MKQNLVLSKILSLCIIVISFSCSVKNSEKEYGSLELDAANNKDSVFVFKDHNLSIRIPKNWRITKINEPFFVFKMECDTSMIFCPNLVAQFLKIDSSQSLNDYTELYLNSLQQKYENFNLIFNTDKSSSTFYMKVLDYKIFERNTNLGGSTAIIKFDSSDQLLILSMMAENDDQGAYAKYGRLFEDILNSIEITNK